jgi:hypothetical protein
MEVWVLYFWIVFANGQQAIMENNDRFTTKSSCYLVAQEKAESLQIELWQTTGIPVQIRHRCTRDDTPT